MKSIQIQYVLDYYANHKPGGHWFDEESMRFFKTKLPDVAYETNSGILFITRETDPDGVKAYSVRRQLVSGDIKTVGAFHSYPTYNKALKAIEALDKDLSYAHREDQHA